MPFNLFINQLPGPDGKPMANVVTIVGDGEDMEKLGSAIYAAAHEETPGVTVDVIATTGVPTRIIVNRLGERRIKPEAQ